MSQAMFKDSMGNDWPTEAQRDAWDWFHKRGSETLRIVDGGDRTGWDDRGKDDSKSYDDAGGFDRPGVK